MSFAERLRHAIETRMERGSIREFHKRIAERDVSGSSYPVIHRYLKGEVMPPLDFLEAAAEVLRVRPAWLILGEGEPTEFETAVSEQQKKSPEDAAIERMLLQIAHLFPEFSRIQPWAHRVFWQTIIRLVKHRTAHNPDGVSNVRIAERSAVFVAGEIANPIREIEPGNITDDQLSDYVASICQALMRLIPSGATARVETPVEEA